MRFVEEQRLFGDRLACGLHGDRRFFRRRLAAGLPGVAADFAGRLGLPGAGTLRDGLFPGDLAALFLGFGEFAGVALAVLVGLAGFAPAGEEAAAFRGGVGGGGVAEVGLDERFGVHAEVFAVQLVEPAGVGGGDEPFAVVLFHGLDDLRFQARGVRHVLHRCTQALARLPQPVTHTAHRFAPRSPCHPLRPEVPDPGI